MNRNRLLQYSIAKGIGPSAIKKLLKYLANNNLSLDDLDDHFEECINTVCSNPEIIANIHLMENAAVKPGKELSDRGIKILVESDCTYPQFLARSLGKNCPPILFASGNIQLLNSPSVGFCGSRKTSVKGLNIAEDCVTQLVEKKITIVSGYASGTDLAAHKKALQCGGKTIFVLAEGILRFSIKREIRDMINLENHVFISQFMPNITWNASNAMKRNSVIIGLSQAMMLIESGRTGGTFAAGEEALHLKCPLFVIDYAHPEISAEANHYFIERGGIPVRKTNGEPSLTNLFAILQKNDSRVCGDTSSDDTPHEEFWQTSLFQDI